MSKFFSNVFKWPPRPIRAVKSLFTEDSITELEDWVEPDYGYYHIRLIGGQTEKQLRNGVRKILKWPRNPVGVRIKPGWDFEITTEDSMVCNLLGGAITPIWYPRHLVPTSNTISGISFEEMPPWYLDGNHPQELLREILQPAAIKVHSRTVGNAAGKVECSNCGEVVTIDDEGECPECDIDLVRGTNIMKDSTSLGDLLRPIQAYEKAEDRKVLPYAKEA